MLGKIFDIDGGLMGFFTKISDLVILNIVFVITCIPIVTVGPALTALYSVTLKMARGEEVRVFRRYLSAFKENFKISCLSGLILLGIVTIAYADWRISSLFTDSMRIVVSWTAYIIFFLCFVVALFLFPYIARFKNTLKLSFRSAVFMAIAALPKTLILIGITAVFVVISIFVLAPPYAILMWLIFEFSFLAYIQSNILKKVFTRYENEEA